MWDTSLRSLYLVYQMIWAHGQTVIYTIHYNDVLLLILLTTSVWTQDTISCKKGREEKEVIEENEKDEDETITQYNIPVLCYTM